MGYNGASYHQLPMSHHEVPGSQPQSGLCPTCGKVSAPLLVIGVQRWAVCDEHKLCWHVFSSRIHSVGTPAAPDWALNRERLNQYTIVQPTPCDLGRLDHELRLSLGVQSHYVPSDRTAPKYPVASDDEPPKVSATLAPITIRHLCYHVTPFASNDVWHRNVQQLLKRIDQFNGKRVVAIVTGSKFTSPAEVMAAMDGHGIEFVTMPNDTWLRERVSAEALFERVESTADNEATWYGHAKGVATAGDTRGVTYWRNAMYHELLDDPEKIGDLLTRHPTIGTHRLRDGHYPDGLKGSWHFAGTFWWFRNDAFFSQPWREKIPKSGWGMEALPGLMFRYEDSCCVFMDDPRNPYDPSTYEEPINDDESEPAKSDALKLEIGGGLTPRRDGYLNVDRLDCADVRCDFDAPDFTLPFDDDSVLDVYSSHCLEHIVNLKRLLNEIVRVCRIGARVEIRVPHWLSNMANCHGHVQTISHEQVDHWVRSALEYWWDDNRKRLKIYHTKYHHGGAFTRWKRMLPTASDQDILELCPDACHEIEYVFHVTGNS